MIGAGRVPTGFRRAGVWPWKHGRGPLLGTAPVQAGVHELYLGLVRVPRDLLQILGGAGVQRRNTILSPLLLLSETLILESIIL